jgi:PAS domain S-box-containing protein
VRRAPGSRIVRYGLAVVLVGLALLLSELVHSIIPHSVDYLFLAAIVASGWLGGRGPGLLAAGVAPLVLDYFFLPPLYTPGISLEAGPYVLPFLLSALAAAWVSSVWSTARETRARLERSEEKFRRILTNQPDIAWTGDENGRIVYISPKVADWTGYTSQEIYAGGSPFLLSRVHPDDLPRVLEATQALFSQGASLDEEFRFQRRDDTWIWLHNRAMGPWQENGVTIADGVICDVSRRKWSELELQAKTAFLEAQANSTIDGILVVDAADRRILHNRRLVEMFGIPSELLANPAQLPVREHMIRTIKDFNPGWHVDVYRHPQETYHTEFELKNGMMLEVHSSPVKGTGGEDYGRIWTFRDMTERRRHEDTLRQLSAAVEQSPVSVVIADTHGDIRYTNRKFTECTGYTLEEVRGKNPRILNSGYSPPHMYETLWATILAGKEWRGEFRNRKKNGELYWESAVLSPIVDANGSITHFLAVKEDITERRALEGDLRQAQKLEGIGQLAAGIAHEINTPTQFVTDNLTFLRESCEAALGLLELYRKAVREDSERFSADAIRDLTEAERVCDLEFIGAEVPRAITQSLEGVRRIAKIVRAVKEFSHPDLAEKAEADLNRGIASTITIAHNEWKYVADLTTDFDEALPRVLCYPGDVNQVVLNLIVNAAHAIRQKLKGTGKGQIVVRTRTCGPFAEIAVSDTGTGIPPEIRTRIFEPFFTTKEVGAGTGQGLALAHSVVVKKHQGKIWCETEMGAGTTFFVHLPIGPARGAEEKRC